MKNKNGSRSLDRCLFFALLLITGVLGFGLASAQAATRTWVAATGTNDWFTDSNWSDNTRPSDGDTVVITNAGAGVLLTNSAGYFGSLLVSNNATLIFSNWDTTLSATNIAVALDGTITCAGPFTNNAMTNRVYLICSNLTVDVGGRIDVNEKGWQGGIKGPGEYDYYNGNGPGGGYPAYYYGCGGGHGGLAYIQTPTAGNPYDSVSGPVLPGSGGGASTYTSGGNGGGAIRIAAAGRVLVNGSVTADGRAANGYRAGGGSGGSVYISCRTFGGTSGSLSANGGMQNMDVNWTDMGGSGGGRVAIAYDPAAQTNDPIPSVSISALPGWDVGPSHASDKYIYSGDLGTIWLPDSTWLVGDAANINGEIRGVTAWMTTNYTVDYRWIRFAEEGVQVTVSNNLKVVNRGRFEIGGSLMGYYGGRACRHSTGECAVLRVGGNLDILANSQLSVYSSPTNGGAVPYGALVDVTSNMTVDQGCWVYPRAHPTNAAGPFFRAKNLSISDGAGFNADWRGCSGGEYQTAGNWSMHGYGPGQGLYSISGGGYGGVGGCNWGGGGPTYGSSNAPAEAGSGGGSGYWNNYGASGGGLIRLEVSDQCRLSGTLTANGQAGGTQAAAGGSGGGIYVRCHTLTASNAILSANGGNGGDPYTTIPGGCGGGGRIAVWRMYDTSNGSVSNSVAGGANTAYPGGAGSLVWGWLPVPGAIFTVY